MDRSNLVSVRAGQPTADTWLEHWPVPGSGGPVVTCPARVATLATLWPLAAGMGTKTDRSSIRLERNRPIRHLV